ncbi:uncharacterized protein LOC124155676 [Ischnura elegans]|uniref:uncharacterized protein LOC124155676 n=1 Tax=Ischnura elegans TaxID=197161 RepID=UPI001ED89A67|nr:uncharacterized protein LOC124155676 [Ischnura elegans]
MAAPSRRPIAPKLGNSFLTRQLSLQSPNPPVAQPLQQCGQPLTQQHRKLAFRRQSSEDLSLRRGRRRGRDSPSPAASPASERSKCRNPPSVPSEDKRTNTASDRSSDVRWKQDGGQTTAVPPTTSPSLFNRHFPPNKEQQPQPCTSALPTGASGPVAGRPITPARPRPVRLAWAEKRSPTVVQAVLPTASDPHQRAPEDPTEEGVPVEVVAKKMGQPKPVTGSALKAQLVRSHHGLPSMVTEKDSVLQTRQQLADKLRRAWWGEDQLRPNLDIFLTCLANDGNVVESTPLGEEGASRKNLEDSSAERSEASSELRESKMISIKIDTVASENSSREGENDDLMSVGESKVSLEGGSLTKDANCRPKSTAQVPLHSPSKSTSSTSPSKGLCGVSIHSTDTKASFESSSSHESGNEFVCGVEICERVKDSIHSGRACDDGSGGGLGETAAERSMVTASQALSAAVPQADAARTSGQVTNGLSSTVKGASETKREPSAAAAGKSPAVGGQGNEAKSSGAVNASLRRAQFRNSSMNRKTLTRSVDSIPSCTAPASGTSTSGSTAPGVVATNGSSRALAGASVVVVSGGSAMDVPNRAKEEAMKAKRGVQQVPDFDKVERNPWKRNAESAGIMRATTVDGGEGPLELTSSLPSPSAVLASSSPYFSGTPSQTRPSTANAASRADRPAIRSSASFATAAKHRQNKASSKRRTVRRSAADDEEGAEGEGGAGEECAGRSRTW